jgi:hypothetical protein
MRSLQKLPKELRELEHEAWKRGTSGGNRPHLIKAHSEIVGSDINGRSIISESGDYSNPHLKLAGVPTRTKIENRIDVSLLISVSFRISRIHFYRKR